MHFPYITYGMIFINDSIPTKHLHWENVCNICERALTFSHFHILILLFPSIFCWDFRYFVSETCLISGKRQYTDKTLTLRKYMCMRASEASELRKFRYLYILKLLFFLYFVGTSDALSVQRHAVSAYNHVPTNFSMYRQISKCTDKSPKRHYWGGAIAPLPPPPPPLATLMTLASLTDWRLMVLLPSWAANLSVSFVTPSFDHVGDDEYCCDHVDGTERQEDHRVRARNVEDTTCRK